MAKRKKTRKKKVSYRQKLIKSIERSMRYREKKGYIIDPEYKESIRRKRTKTLEEIHGRVALEIGKHSIYIDPLTNASMKGTQAKRYIRQQKAIRKYVEEEIKQARSSSFYDLDSEADYGTMIDDNVISIIEWLKSNIMNLPDTKYLKGKVFKDYSGYKQTLLNYIDDRLMSADAESTQSYVNYISDHEAELIAAFEIIAYDSDGGTVETSFTRILDILKGGSYNFSDAQEIENLNEYYEDFEEV